MPVLENNRWETFARGIAEGKSHAQAYLAAGYAPDPKNAPRMAYRLLREHPEILVRADELQRQMVERNAQANQQALVSLALDRETVLADAAQTLEIALGRRKVKSTRTRTTVVGKGKDAHLEIQCVDYMTYAHDGAVAARLIELLGREFGMFLPTPKARPDPLDALSHEQLVEGVRVVSELIAARQEEEMRRSLTDSDSESEDDEG